MTWIVALGNGHGGIENNIYLTPPRKGKMYIHPKTSEHEEMTIHEGESNRDIVRRVIYRLYNKGIPYYHVVPETKDTSMYVRVKRINNFYARHNKKVFFFSIHSNAAGRKSAGKAHGSEVHIAKRSSRDSKRLAALSEQTFAKHFPEAKFRGVVSRKNFYMVRETDCPAVLFEIFFMDNYKECVKYLKNDKGRDRIADWIVNVIELFIQEKTATEM